MNVSGMNRHGPFEVIHGANCLFQENPIFFPPLFRTILPIRGGEGSDGFMNLIVHEPATQLVNVLMAELPLPATGNVSAVCLQRLCRFLERRVHE